MTVALGWLWWAGCTAPVPSAVDLPPTVYLAEFADDPVARRPVTVVALVADDRDPASALTIGVEVDGVLLARVRDETDVVDVKAEVLRCTLAGVGAEVGVGLAAGEW